MNRAQEQIMTRAVRQVSTFLLFLCLSALPALAAGDANLFLGRLDSSEDLFDAAGVDGQSEWGVTVSLDFDWPVMLAVDLLSSSDDSTRTVVTAYELQYRTDVDRTELDVGVRKLFLAERRLEPYVGGGLAWMRLDVRQVAMGSLGPMTEFTDTILDDDDSSFGFWLNAGLLYRIGSHLNIGVDVRYSDAEVELRPVDSTSDLRLDSGGTSYGLLLGYHW
jgi:opacity protein-like surface antigen